MSRSTVVLKPGREKSLVRRHPWVFSGAVAGVEGNPPPGGTVAVVDSRGAFVARGAYSPASRIPVRVWSFDPGVEIDPAFFRAKVAEAAARRHDLAARGVTAYRVLHGESDGLPGVVADRYEDFVVVQIGTAGAEAWRDVIVEALAEIFSPAGIYERSDLPFREKEGLLPRTGILRGAEPPGLVPFREAESRFVADLRGGQKTGFYLDQRENRAVVRSLAAGRDVLNAFAYTGSFGVAALRGGATAVTNVDTSAVSLRIAEENVRRNDLDAGLVTNVEGDVFAVLRGYRNEERRFGMVILDPPKFADSKASLPKAARGYKDVNWLAFRLLRPGGVLVTFSCSGILGFDLFQKIVADAALDAGREGRIVARLGAGSDHPTLLPFPEGSYLKGLVVTSS